MCAVSVQFSQWNDMSIFVLVLPQTGVKVEFFQFLMGAEQERVDAKLPHYEMRQVRPPGWTAPAPARRLGTNR